MRQCKLPDFIQEFVQQDLFFDINPSEKYTWLQLESTAFKEYRINTQIQFDSIHQIPQGILFDISQFDQNLVLSKDLQNKANIKYLDYLSSYKAILTKQFKQKSNPQQWHEIVQQTKDSLIEQFKLQKKNQQQFARYQSINIKKVTMDKKFFQNYLRDYNADFIQCEAWIKRLRNQQEFKIRMAFPVPDESYWISYDYKKYRGENVFIALKTAYVNRLWQYNQYLQEKSSARESDHIEAEAFEIKEIQQTQESQSQVSVSK